ncbi:hypothetical protein NMG60_11028356 [Bertholletia excelsa]
MASKGLNKPCILLIVIAGMERFAFKGVASNLVTYLTDVVKMSNSSAAKTVNGWCGFTSMLPLLVAPLADSLWDRYSTILFFSFLYVLGLLAMTSTAMVWPWVPTNKTSTSSLFWSLCMISLGQGGYNPSLQAFGAKQLETEEDPVLPCTCSTKTEEGSKKKSLFFQWWYFGICSGCLLGVSVMSYVQDTLGWGLGFAIPAIVMVTSVVFFCCGNRLYTYEQAKKGEFKSFQDMVHAVKVAASKVMGVGLSRQPNRSDEAELELQEKPLFHQGLDAGEGLDESTNNGVNLLEIARVVLHLLPIWTMLLMFAVIFQQPATFFTKQGMTMKRNIGKSFKIPPATLQSAITVSIVLLMPLYDTLFTPLVRVLTRNEKGISVMQRMGVGMFLSVVAMLIAALVEVKRLGIGKSTPTSETVPLSIFWLLPQYVLLGISDIFTVVGMQEFFYSEVPQGMRTMGIALYTSVFGVGSFLSAISISMIEYFTRLSGGKSWFSDDMREARLDNYYWLLALASAFSLLVFVFLCRFYNTKL